MDAERWFVPCAPVMPHIKAAVATTTYLMVLVMQHNKFELDLQSNRNEPSRPAWAGMPTVLDLAPSHDF
jgi:hypothetical protein